MAHRIERARRRTSVSYSAGKARPRVIEIGLPDSMLLSFSEIPRYIDDYDAVSALGQQAHRDDLSTLVVKKILIPLAFDELWQHNCDGAIRVLSLDFQDVIDDRLHHESKR